MEKHELNVKYYPKSRDFRAKKTRLDLEGGPISLYQAHGNFFTLTGFLFKCEVFSIFFFLAPLYRVSVNMFVQWLGNSSQSLAENGYGERLCQVKGIKKNT